MQGQGLGRALMERIIDHGRRQGLREIWGHVLSENRGMLGLVRKLGFSVKAAVDDPGIMDVKLALDDPAG